jgi:metallophosphoesterase (TIGR03768 family)
MLFSIILLLVSALCQNCRKIEDSNHYEQKVFTTVDRTIIPYEPPAMPTVAIDDPANFSKFGFGKWHYGPGIPYQKRLDLVPTEYNTEVKSAARLLRFFAMTDIHITDKESPAQAIFFKEYAGNNALSCYSALMLYTPQVLNAAIRTINGLHKDKPFDFGIALGDLTNNSQYNELRWFIDIMDGKEINPDSGDKDDPIEGPNNDYQDPFQATGLDQSIPWYAALGNHDHLWMGAKPMNDHIREVLTGENILQTGNIFSDPDAFSKNTFSMGTLDGSSPYGKIIGSGVVSQMTSIPKIPADANRHAVSKAEWIHELSNTNSFPIGHGFIQNDPRNIFGACYSFEPVSDLPIKVIVLDDTQDDSDISDDIYGHGSLENGRHDWLIQQLQVGQEENKLMIIAAHIPIGVAPGTELGWYSPAVETSLINELKSYPNLILWISGHRHLNTVTAIKSSDPNHPENGFWEVETKSVREFPQQFRTFDIVRNSDNSISIFATDVDVDSEEGSLASISRSYAIASNQIYGINESPNPSGSTTYNVELVKLLSPGMQVKIQNYGTSVSK